MPIPLISTHNVLCTHITCMHFSLTTRVIYCKECWESQHSILTILQGMLTDLV